MTSTRDYDRVAHAIHFIREHQAQQPELAEVAHAVGLSEYHFQRLFRRWAGISPKRFLQHLTVQCAKELLAEPRPMLDVAMEVGLSGPGRLHDLFINADGVTPGEFRAGGDDVDIRYGVVPTPLGEALVARTDRGICWFQFTDPGEDPIAGLERAWPRAQLIKDVRGTKDLVARIFSNHGPPSPAGLVLHLRGTNFQLKVWQALLGIPVGRVSSYAGVARAIGQDGAHRAVGTAVGSNDIAVLVPCHRVIRGDGHVGSYRWGTTRKLALQAREGAQHIQETV